MKIAAQAKALVLAVRASALRMAVAIGKFLWYRDAADQFSATDASTKAFTKARAESLGLSDTTSADTQKPRIDLASAAEDTAASITLPKASTASVTVETRAETSKPLAELTAAESAATIDLERPISHQAGSTDENSLATSKPLSQPTYALDAQALALTRGFLDQSASSDDQAVEAIKPISHSASAAEFLAGAMSKPLIEASITTDAHDNWTFTRPTASTAAIYSDALAIVGKSLLESAGLADQIDAKQFAKALGDVCASCDSFDGQSVAIDSDVQRIEKVLSDQVSVHSAMAIAAQLAKSAGTQTVDLATTSWVYPQTTDDPSTVQEQHILALARALTDQVALQDGVAHSFTPAGVLDQCQATQDFSFIPSKGLVDSIFAADGGDLVSQGYCDLSYFAEDYVGARQSF